MVNDQVGMDAPSETSPVRIDGDSAACCHVVRLYRTEAAIGNRADSPTLAVEAVAAFRDQIPLWWTLDAIAVGLRRAIEHLAVGPVALLVAPNEREPLSVPDALRVSFEPQELNDREERLSGLCDSTSIDPGGESSRARWGDFWTRVGRIGLSVLGLVWIVDGLIAFFRPRADRFIMIFHLGLGLFLLATGLIAARARDQWWLVPGGMVLRSPAWLPWRTKLRLVTPQIADLILMQRGERFNAMLFRNGLFAARPLTRLEATALLAAWQSPLKPPRLNQLADLE